MALARIILQNQCSQWGHPQRNMTGCRARGICRWTNLYNFYEILSRLVLPGPCFNFGLQIVANLFQEYTLRPPTLTIPDFFFEVWILADASWKAPTEMVCSLSKYDWTNRQGLVWTKVCKQWWPECGNVVSFLIRQHFLIKGIAVALKSDASSVLDRV